MVWRPSLRGNSILIKEPRRAPPPETNIVPPAKSSHLDRSLGGVLVRAGLLKGPISQPFWPPSKAR